MPTPKIYKKVIEVSEDLLKLGLNGWQTELTIHNKKKKIDTEIKVIFKLKTRRKK